MVKKFDADYARRFTALSAAISDEMIGDEYDDFIVSQCRKSAADALANSYAEGLTDATWESAARGRLNLAAKPPPTGAIAMTMHHLAGNMMDDGYQRTPGGTERLTIHVIDGHAYDDIGYGLPDMRLPLHVTSDGRLAGWGQGVTFDPDAGELARVGLAA